MFAGEYMLNTLATNVYTRDLLLRRNVLRAVAPETYVCMSTRRRVRVVVLGVLFLYVCYCVRCARAGAGDCPSAQKCAWNMRTVALYRRLYDAMMLAISVIWYTINRIVRPKPKADQQVGSLNL